MKIWMYAGLLLTAFGLAGLGIAQAQAIDETDCRAACYEEQKACANVCSEHDNPVECDGECRRELEDCLAECR